MTSCLIKSNQAPTRFSNVAIGVSAAITVVFVSMRVWDFTAFSLWGGETFILDGIRLGWRGMLTYVVEDLVHPPLFYALTKAWIAIGGESLIWLKLLPLLLAFASIAPFLLLCRELNLGSSETNLAFTLLAVNGFLVHYAQELRMYGLFMLLSLVSYWLFARFFNAQTNNTANGNLAALFAINLLMVYTHYFGWVLVGLELTFLLFFGHRKVSDFLASTAVLMLCFTPWVHFVIEAMLQKGGLRGNVGWIAPPNLSTIVHFYANLNGGYETLAAKLFSILLFGYPILLWFRHTLTKKPTPGAEIFFWWLFVFTFLPVIGLFVGSRLFRYSAWVDRYLIFVAVPSLLMFSAAVCRIRPIWLSRLTMATVLLWSVFGGIADLKSNRIAWESPELGSRIPWETLARKVVQAEPAGKVKIYSVPVQSNHHLTGSWAIETSMQYYLNSFDKERFKFESVRNIDHLFTEGHENHFWVATFDLGGGNGEHVQEQLLSRGNHVGRPVQARHGDKMLLLIPVWRRYRTEF